jgi:hypothetical protein
MNLSMDRETFSPPEDQTWLGSAHGTTTCKPITLDGDVCLAEFPSGTIPSGIVLVYNTTTDLWEPRSASMTEEVQTVTVDATGGTFTLTFDGEETDPIAEAATAAAVQAALEALPNVNAESGSVENGDFVAGDIVVTGGAGGPWTITFQADGQYGGENTPELTADATLLTGGAGTAVVATTTAGGAESPATAARGHLFTTKVVKPGSTGARVSAALFWHGSVITDNLPNNHGWDASVAADLPQIQYV